MSFVGDFLRSVAGGLSDKYLGTNFLSQQAAQQANEFNAEQAQINRDWQQQMMQQQNVYNSPFAQMQRARDAGLNPSLLYGNPIQEAASSSGGNAATGVAASGANGAGDLVSSLQQGLFMKAQKENLEAQTENIKADTKKKGAEFSKIGSEINSIDKTIEKMDVEMNNLRANTNLNNMLGQESAWRIDLLIGQLALFNDTYESQKSILESNAKLTKVQADNWIRECNARINQMSAYVGYLESVKNLNESQKAQVDEMKLVVEQQKNLITKQVEIIQKFGSTKEVLGMINQTLLAGSALVNSVASILAAANKLPTVNNNFGSGMNYSLPLQ